MDVYKQICMHVPIYVYMNTRTYICMYGYMYTRTYVCMHELMFVSVVTNNDDVSDSHATVPARW